MAKEKLPCKHCGTPTASKVGYCGKHFYMSKLKGAPGVAKKARHVPSKANGHAGNGNGVASGRIGLQLSSAAIEHYIRGLDWATFVRQASPDIKARLMEMVIETCCAA